MTAEYKLTVEVYAEKVNDLEQLLCLVAEKVVEGVDEGVGDNRNGSYRFRLTARTEELGGYMGVQHNPLDHPKLRA